MYSLPPLAPRGLTEVRTGDYGRDTPFLPSLLVMVPFRRPLVPLSLTDSDGALLRYASIICTASPPEEVRFAHIAAPGGGTVPLDVLASLRQRMEREVEAHFHADCGSRELEVGIGMRIDMLLEIAVERQHDVIILGHRAERSGSRSLARRLAMTAPSSVWLAPEGASEQLDVIMVAVDLSDNSADALSVATSLAARHGHRRVYAVHVQGDGGAGSHDASDSATTLERFLERSERHGIEVEPVVERRGKAADAILGAAHRRGADLLVMSTRGRSRAAAVLLGSTTSDVLATATIPVLAVKHYGTSMTLRDVLVSQRFWRARGG